MATHGSVKKLLFETCYCSPLLPAMRPGDVMGVLQQQQSAMECKIAQKKELQLKMRCTGSLRTTSKELSQEDVVSSPLCGSNAAVITFLEKKLSDFSFSPKAQRS